MSVRDQDPPAPLTEFAEGVWLDTEPVGILGTKLTATMAVLRLADESLLLYSPLTMTPERQRAVDALGGVSALYAPNTFHHLHIGAWSEAFPTARVHAPAGLARKRPDLRIDRTHGETSAPHFASVIDERHIDGFRLEESVLYYRPAKTLVVADLVHNVGRPQDPWTRLYTRTMGFYDRVALSRMIRLTGFSDRAAARRSVEALLALPIDRVVMGHGTPLTDNAKETLADALGWLLA